MMAKAAILFLRAKECLLSRYKPPLLFTSPSQGFRYNSNQSITTTAAGDFDAVDFEMSSALAEHRRVCDISKWKRINAKRLGLDGSLIPYAPFTILKILRYKGFEAYLVGGCVRDLLLNRVPKDFDVITTASLKQIKTQFYRCIIIGRRFPICRVQIRGSSVEVSSFDTVANQSEEKEEVALTRIPRGINKKEFARWRNSTHRDFTINSLFYDPFKNLIYDYANGLADLKSLELRTVIPAELSFQEDCARILRGLRIAGRLGLSISRDTEIAIQKLCSSLKNLDKFRIMMELNYMLSYGAAKSTIYLLWRFNLLDMFLPFHAAYLDQEANENSAETSMFMKLFFHLDRLVGCDRPCDCSLWIGLLAFHQALVINPQDSLVIWTFASVLYHGNWTKGVKFSREHAKSEVQFATEVSGFTEQKSNKELAEDVTQLASLARDSVFALMDEDALSKSMSRYPSAKCSDLVRFCNLVFVSKKAGTAVAEFFNELLHSIDSDEQGRESFLINYNLLGEGDSQEIRFVLGKVILETLSGGLAETDISPAPLPCATEPIQEHPMAQNLDRVVSHSKHEELSGSGEEILLRAPCQEIDNESQNLAGRKRKLSKGNVAGPVLDKKNVTVEKKPMENLKQYSMDGETKEDVEEDKRHSLSRFDAEEGVNSRICRRVSGKNERGLAEWEMVNDDSLEDFSKIKQKRLKKVKDDGKETEEDLSVISVCNDKKIRWEEKQLKPDRYRGQLSALFNR